MSAISNDNFILWRQQSEKGTRPSFHMQPLGFKVDCSFVKRDSKPWRGQRSKCHLSFGDSPQSVPSFWHLYAYPIPLIGSSGPGRYDSEAVCREVMPSVISVCKLFDLFLSMVGARLCRANPCFHHPLGWNARLLYHPGS